MTISAAEPLRAPLLSARLRAVAAGFALASSAAMLALRLSPAGSWFAPLALGILIAAATAACLLDATEADTAATARIFATGAVLLTLAFVSDQPGETLEPLFGLGALALMGALTFRLLGQRRAASLKRQKILAAIALCGGLFAYNAWYVLASRDLEIADFMFYRLVSVAVATAIDSGRWPQLVLQIASSLKADYSWLPALLPGVALSLGAPLSRAVYQGAIMTAYAAPALAALGWLARELAVRARLGVTRSTTMWGLAIVAVAVAYPTGIAVAARGMPDIGGLALYVYALNLADKLVRALAARRAAPLARRIALALALTLAAMFLFRRWYAFAGVGILAGLAVELAAAVARGQMPVWRSALRSAALAGLTGLAMVSPVLVDWLPNPGAHDYASLYAAYRKPTDVMLGLIGDWWGYTILASAVLAGALLMARGRGGRLMRLTFGAAIVAGGLFLRIQTPYVHHVFLIAPAVTATLGAVAVMLAKRSPALGAAAVALLAAATLTPAGALAPKGLFPTYGRPHAPRSDMAELARMKAWVDAHAAPEHKVCGLGSSYTFSGQLIDELWQLKADRSPLHLDSKLRTSVAMSDVDTMQGPPSPELGDCAYILVGDPVQTHLVPAYQQTVIVPSREMLTGIGIGAHYARTGEAFDLEKGVRAIVFARTSPLTDADMLALTERWRAARSGE